MSRRHLLSLLTVLACLAGVGVAAINSDLILAGDVIPYRERMAQLFGGRVPYLGFDLEHLPGALLPMMAAWLLGGSRGIQPFTAAFAVLTTITLVITVGTISRLESDLGPGAARRWLVATAPLLPFLLFRNDSLSVLLTMLAFRSLALNGGGDGWASLGVITKVWPGVWAVIEWWKGRRLRAVLIALLMGSALLLLRSAPVLAIQRPIGVHVETLAGSLLGLMRSLLNHPMAIHRTSALYIEADWTAWAINLLPAVAIAIPALRIVGRRFEFRSAWLLVGVLTGCVMVASPLFSPQYMAWLTPFASISRRSTVTVGVANALTLLMTVLFDSALRGSAGWFGLAIVRNALVLVTLTLMLASLSLGQLRERPVEPGRQ